MLNLLLDYILLEILVIIFLNFVKYKMSFWWNLLFKVFFSLLGWRILVLAIKYFWMIHQNCKMLVISLFLALLSLVSQSISLQLLLFTRLVCNFYQNRVLARGLSPHSHLNNLIGLIETKSIQWLLAISICNSISMLRAQDNFSFFLFKNVFAFL